MSDFDDDEDMTSADIELANLYYEGEENIDNGRPDLAISNFEKLLHFEETSASSQWAFKALNQLVVLMYLQNDHNLHSTIETYHRRMLTLSMDSKIVSKNELRNAIDNIFQCIQKNQYCLEFDARLISITSNYLQSLSSDKLWFHFNLITIMKSNLLHGRYSYVDARLATVKSYCAEHNYGIFSDYYKDVLLIEVSLCASTKDTARLNRLYPVICQLFPLTHSFMSLLEHFTSEERQFIYNALLTRKECERSHFWNLVQLVVPSGILDMHSLGNLDTATSDSGYRPMLLDSLKLIHRPLDCSIDLIQLQWLIKRECPLTYLILHDDSDYDSKNKRLTVLFTQTMNNLSLTLSRSLSGLTVLAIQSCPLLLTSHMKAIIDACCSLVELDLDGSHNAVDDIILRSLANKYHSTLEVIDISGDLFTDTGIAALVENCGMLHAIGISHGIAAFAFDDELVDDVAVEADVCTDVAILSIASHCVNLKRIHVSLRGISDECIMKLAERLTSLEDLYFHYGIGDDAFIRITERCKQLQTISLYENTSDTVLASLRSCPHLQILDISNCTLLSHDAINDFVVAFPNLNEISLPPYLTDATIIATLESCKSLTTFRVSHHEPYLSPRCELITDASITCLVRHSSHLVELALCGCIHITTIALFELARSCPNIESLKLSGCVQTSEVVLFEFARRCEKLAVIEAVGIFSKQGGLSLQTKQVLIQICPSLLRVSNIIHTYHK